MTDIKLINENGVIKGIDKATGNEVPVEFDDLKAGKTTTESLWSDSDVLVYGTSGELIKKIDGSGSNVLTDAYNAVNGACSIHLPATQITESTGQIGGATDTDRVSIIGHPEMSRINYEANAPLIESDGIRNVRYQNLVITGRGAGVDSPAVWKYSSGTSANTVFDQVVLDGFGGPAMDISGTLFNSEIRDFRASNMDAGNDDAIIQAGGNLAHSSFGVLFLSAASDLSGSNSDALFISGGHLTCNYLNLGGSVKRGVNITAGGFGVGLVNYEPTGQVGTDATPIFDIETTSPCYVGGTEQTAGSAGFVYELEGTPGNIVLGPFNQDGGSRTSSSVVRLDSDLGDICYYFGASGEVSNGSGSTLSNAIICFGDLVEKTSTGTGA